MKLTRPETMVFALFFAFAVFLTGYFFGQRAPAGTYVISAQSTALPAAAGSSGQDTPAALPAGPEESGQDTPAGQKAAGQGASAGPETVQININTASAETLATLPGIGLKRAQAIVEYRTEHGPFRYPEHLINVSGIGEGILSELLPLITTEEDTP